MGANFNTRSVPDSVGQDEIKRRWADAVGESLYQDGHSYSGEIGMLGSSLPVWEDKQLPSKEEAKEWLVENHEKWEPAIAVSYIDNEEKHWLIGGWCSS